MKKMSLTLAKEIKKHLQVFQENIPDLNNGGCGVFACYFAEKMIAVGYDAHIIELHSNTIWDLLMGGINIDSNFLERNNKNIHSAAVAHAMPDSMGVRMDRHFCVKIDDFYFDSENVCQSTSDTVICWGNQMDIIGEVPLKDFEYVSIENRGGLWNDEYNPSQNDSVKELIESSLAFLC